MIDCMCVCANVLTYEIACVCANVLTYEIACVCANVLTYEIACVQMCKDMRVHVCANV